MIGVDIAVLRDEAARRLGGADPRDLELHAWPEVFSSTAGPRGGVGDQTLTRFDVFAFREGIAEKGLKYCAGLWREWSGEVREPWGGRAPVDPLATEPRVHVTVGWQVRATNSYRAAVKVDGKIVWTCDHFHSRKKPAEPGGPSATVCARAALKHAREGDAMPRDIAELRDVLIAAGVIRPR